MGIRHIEYECLCGNKIVFLEPVGGVVMPPECEVCGRGGVFRLKDGELYYQGADFLMEELEGLGLKKIKIKGLLGSWIKMQNWRFTD